MFELRKPKRVRNVKLWQRQFEKAAAAYSQCVAAGGDKADVAAFNVANLVRARLRALIKKKADVDAVQGLFHVLVTWFLRFHLTAKRLGREMTTLQRKMRVAGYPEHKVASIIGGAISDFVQEANFSEDEDESDHDEDGPLITAAHIVGDVPA